MKEQFIPYELALKLKELGFDEECIGYYQVVNNKTILFKIPTQPSHTSSQEKVKYIYGIKSIQAPLWQQAFDWFRIGGYYNYITSHLEPWGEDGMLEESYGYKIFYKKCDYKCEVKEVLKRFDTYEEARLECLKQLIKIVENEKI